MESVITTAAKDRNREELEKLKRSASQKALFCRRAESWLWWL